MASSLKIAFIGIGLMGNHMARNLLKAGHELFIWNRTPPKLRRLKKMALIYAQALKRLSHRQILSS